MIETISSETPHMKYIGGGVMENHDDYFRPLVDKIPDFDYVELVRLNHNKRKSTITVKHSVCSETFDIGYANLYYRRKCPICKPRKYMTRELFLEEFNKRDDADEYKVTNTFTGLKEPIVLIHKCGKSFEMIAADLIYKRQSKCPCVYGKNSFKHSLEELRERIVRTNSEYSLVSVPDENNIRVILDTVIMKHHVCDKEFPIIPHNFFNGRKQRCPYCSPPPVLPKDSKGSKKVEKWLINNDIDFVKEKRLPGMVSPVTGRKLRIDFYLPAYRMAIEFDGTQHYISKPSRIFTKDVIDRVRINDDAKDKYCMENFIPLLRLTEEDIVTGLYLNKLAIFTMYLD